MFITFEGIDGSGKSTQARMLESRLLDSGRHVVLVREPGGTALSEAIRALLLDDQYNITPVAELLLFSSARAQLAHDRIRPALDQGNIVICDRFFDSTTAYQGGGRNVAPMEWIQSFNLFVTEGLVPHRTYVLDVPLEVALARRDVRSASRQKPQKRDRMESAVGSFFADVQDAYRKLADEDPERIRLIDGTFSPERIRDIIWNDLAGLLSQTEHRSPKSL